MDEDVRFKDDRHFVTSLARGLRIISAFGPGDRALENAELARRTGLPRGTVARFTHTLTQLDYMTAIKGGRGYALAPRVLELGQAAAISTALRDVALPAMKALSELGSFSVALGVASDRGIRYLDIAKRPEAVVLNLEPGAIIPIPPSAIGRAW
jgi:DNA-binding IclR family transcriptional regulator